jgi:hypothetical protein
MTDISLSSLYDECQTLGGRLAVVDTAVVERNQDSANATFSADTNMGDCLHNIPECES